VNARKRLFFAVEFSSAVHERLVRSLAELRSRALPPRMRVNWVSDDSLHVTTKFLGNTDAEELDLIVAAAVQALRGIAPFPLRAKGTGCFPKAIWAGVEDPSGRLAEIANRLDEAMSKLGFPAEPRKFHPHVTFGRIKEGNARALLPKLVGMEWGESWVSEVILFESRTLPTGSVYEAISRFPLG
jgi:RNA 2',3'-cyclic 3'-phosphodiesterase